MICDCPKPAKLFAVTSNPLTLLKSQWHHPWWQLWTPRFIEGPLARSSIGNLFDYLWFIYYITSTLRLVATLSSRTVTRHKLRTTSFIRPFTPRMTELVETFCRQFRRLKVNHSQILFRIRDAFSWARYVMTNDSFVHWNFSPTGLLWSSLIFRSALVSRLTFSSWFILSSELGKRWL